jgi:hypothetical protein
MRIFTSNEHLLVNGPNQSFGNHLLHLFSVYYVSKKLNIPFKISCNSNLDNVFELSEFREDGNPKIAFNELFGGNVDEYHEKELQNYNFFEDINKSLINIETDFQLKGWFWNSKLLPDKTFFDTFKIKKHLLEQITKKDFIYNSNALVVHYRGKDFKTHTVSWGDIRLKEDYYKACVEDFLTKNPLTKIILISDDLDTISQYFKSFTNIEVVLESNDYIIDWLILLFAKNLICSNSSYCYTAGWFNKKIVYQPAKFFTRYLNTEKHFPPNPYYNNSIIL